MKTPLTIHRFFYLTLCVLFVAGCSSNSSLVSSFSKRKYTQGIFKDKPAGIPDVAAKTANSPTIVQPKQAEPVTPGNERKTVATYNGLTKEVKSSVLQTALAISKGQVKKFTKKYTESTRSIAEQPSTAAPGMDSSKQTALVLIITAAALLLLAILFSSSLGAVGTFMFLAAVVFGVIGITMLGKKSNNNSGNSNNNQNTGLGDNAYVQQNSGNNTPQTNYGLTGLIIVLASILVYLLTGLIGLSLAVGGASSSVLIALLVVYGIFLALLITGIVFCIKGRTHPNDKHRGAALAGLIVGGILMALFLIGVVGGALGI